MQGAISGLGFLRLQLSGGLALTFCVSNTSAQVDWTVEDTHRSIGEETDGLTSDELFFIDNQRRYLWEKKKIIQTRLHRPIQQIHAGWSWVYLYVADCPILLLSRLVIQNSGESLLYWDDTD